MNTKLRKTKYLIILVISLLMNLSYAEQNTFKKYEHLKDNSYGTMKVNGKEVKIKGDPIVKKYGIGMNEYEDIREMLEASLTEKGRATYISRMRSVLVIDQVEGHNRVIDILNALHEEAYNIQIEVEYNDVRNFESMGISLKTGPIIINDGKVRIPNNGRIDIDGRKNSQKSNTKMSLTVMSGGRASLWSVKQIMTEKVYSEYTLIPRHVRHGSKPIIAREALVEMRNIGTELYIKPTYLGQGLVRIEVLPTITAIDKLGKKQSFEVQKVSTTVTGAVGQRIHIGGNNENMNKFFASILQPTGIGKQTGSKVLDIYVTPKIQKVGQHINK